MTLPFERQNSAFTEAWHNLDLLAFITQLGSLGVVLNLSALVLELFDWTKEEFFETALKQDFNALRWLSNWDILSPETVAKHTSNHVTPFWRELRNPWVISTQNLFV